MDTDDQEYWADLEVQAAILHSRLRDLFESDAVRLVVDPLRIPNTPESKLAHYLHFLQTQHPLFMVGTDDEYKKRRNAELRKFCIDPKHISEAYFKKERERRISLGLPEIPLSDEYRAQLVDGITKGQQKRLKQWVKHLNSESNGYPIWFRYWVLSNIVKLSEYNTQTGRFPKRSSSSTSNFPELNPDVISDIYRHITDSDFLSKKRKEQAGRYFRLETRDELSILPPTSATFSKLYQFWTYDFLRRVSPKDLDQTNGIWVEFNEAREASDLARSVSGHNTGWCIANIGEGEKFLRFGQVLVYFTPLPGGEHVVPRLCLRLESGRVIEVRGRGPHQGVEDNLLNVAKEKLSEYRDGIRYFKAVSDMEQLTQVTDRFKAGEKLTRYDLLFLYEIESKIASLGMRPDPRKEMILDSRDRRSDLAFLFGCEPSEVALDPKEISAETVVVGFDVDRKVSFALDRYDEVFAIVGDANFERLTTEFPNVAFVSGDARPGDQLRKLAIVGGNFVDSNSHRGLENLIHVGGNAILSSTRGTYTSLETIGGSLSANYSSAEFPALKKIGLNASFTGCRIRYLRIDLEIGGIVSGEIPPLIGTRSGRPLTI